MSQVGILLPQGLLTSISDSQKFPCSDTFYAMDIAEPSVGEISNDKGKHFSDQSKSVEEPVVNKVELKASSSLNGNTDQQSGANNNKRSKQRYRWKPYHKLSWEERKQRDEHETRRAERLRAKWSSCGIPLAPYNTTQFLMEDHNLQEPDYDRIPGKSHHHHHHNTSDSSDESYYSSPEDEEDFLQQQFAETYKNLHAERLGNMNKAELVQELMTIEDKVETLKKQLEVASAAAKTEAATLKDPEDCTHEEQLEKIRVFKEEIMKLTNENEKLRWENEDLRNRVYESVVK